MYVSLISISNMLDFRRYLHLKNIFCIFWGFFLTDVSRSQVIRAFRRKFSNMFFYYLEILVLTVWLIYVSEYF